MEYEGDGMRLSMEHLVYAAGVDLLFFGHVHSYERTFPVNEMKYVRPKPTVHVVTVGVKATVPNRNIEVRKRQGILEKSEQEKPVEEGPIEHFPSTS
jgi:hypothetical protein